MVAQSDRSTVHWQAIDALRGFAAIWVVLCHIWINLFPMGSSQADAVTWSFDQPWHFYPTFFLFQYGYYGVTIFFVVSGFCIHWPQAIRKQKTGSDDLRLATFYQRRFWRLYPPYFVSLFVAALAMGLMRLQDYAQKGWPLPLPENFYWEAFATQAILINALFLSPFVTAAQRDLNGVYWTLVFELQFYLLYPLLLWCMRRAGLLIVGMVLFAAEVVLLPQPASITGGGEVGPWWYFCISRYFEWYLGVIAAELVARKSEQPLRNWYWVLFGLLSAFSLGAVFHPVAWPWRDLAVASATFFLLLAVLQEESPQPTSRWVQFLAWLGLFSYSLYLIHLPVLRLIHLGNFYIANFLGVPSWHVWMILGGIP
ncbi:MAG TPA: acyltransferase, partial [Gemmatales bacterium]|nr:acyltransferase [Gemmatales bacterium]